MSAKIMLSIYIIVLVGLTGNTIITVNAQGRFDSVPSPDGTFHAIPRTSFTCQNRGAGYYADVETGCQIYHMCDGLGRQFSYACPNTTLFQQRMLVCDHWYMVNCSRSEINFDANLLIGQKDKPFVEEGEYDIRTPRPDLLDQPYSHNYNGDSFRKMYKSNNFQAVQNAIAGINYQKPTRSDKTNTIIKPQQHIVSSTPRLSTIQQYNEPGQYSLNFIRNLAGVTTPLPSQAIEAVPPSTTPRRFDLTIPQQTFSQKFNDRRNVKNEGNFGSNEDPDGQGESTSVQFTASVLNSRVSPTVSQFQQPSQQTNRIPPTPLPNSSIHQQPKQFNYNNNNNNNNRSPSPSILPPLRNVSPTQSSQSNVKTPSIYFEPPVTYPLFGTTKSLPNRPVDSTESPSEKVFSTERSLAPPPSTQSTFIPTTTVAPEVKPVQNQQLQFQINQQRPQQQPQQFQTRQQQQAAQQAQQQQQNRPLQQVSIPNAQPLHQQPIQPTQSRPTQRAPIPQPSRNEQPPLIDIKKPSMFFEPPLKFPLYTADNISNSAESATDTPLKISLATQKIAATQPTPGPFTTAQPSLTTTPVPFTGLNSWAGSLNVPRLQNGVRPIEVNAGEGFRTNQIVDSSARTISSQSSASIPLNSIDTNKNIIAPAIDLLPPHRSIKTYDDSTTVGPLIYYEWKWAVPAFDLEPPVSSDSNIPSTSLNLLPNISPNLSPPSTNTGKPFTASTEQPFQQRGPTARSISVDSETTNDGPSKISSTVAITKPTESSTSTEINDYSKLRQQFSIPDFQFPLESGQPGQFEENEPVNSFQIKIPENETTDKPWYGENSNCPECHPSFVIPGTCEPCIRIR